MFDWAPATTRLVPWGLLAAVVVATLSAAVVLSVAGVAFPALLAPVVAAAVASTAPASLADPAHDLLAPVATSRRRRAAHRLAIVVPACFVSWSLLASLVESDRWLSTLPPTGALVAIGVATSVLVATWRPDASAAAAAAGAAAPLALATASVWIPSERLADAASAWSDHPWPVAAVATTVAVVATRG